MSNLIMQDTFPYWTGYNITKATVQYNNTDLQLYFIQCPIHIYIVDDNTNIYGFLYFSLYNTDNNINTDWQQYVKDVFTEYENIISADDITEKIKSSSLLDGSTMFLSENLYNLLYKEIETDLDIKLYIPDTDIISEISDLVYDELYNRDLYHFIYINKTHIAALPDSSNIYTESELNSFASTFFNIIKEHSINKDTDLDGVTSKIYNAVIDYYIKYKIDGAVALMDLILTSSYSYTPSDTITLSCNCSSSTSNVSITDSCTSKYDTAMQTWLYQMMQDISYFYYKFFYIERIDETTGKICYDPDTDLIDALIELINEFETAGYDLSFTSDTSKFNVCNCSKTNSNNSNVSNCNYTVLDNFKTLLLYIKENNTEGNENKIKAYGSAFAAIIYKMYF